MSNFISGIAKNVVNWVVGEANEVVAAVAGDVLKGAVYGAIIGAAQAAITGGDIGKSALRGAAIGGITTGIASTLIQWSGVDDAVQAETENEKNLTVPVNPSHEVALMASGEKPSPGYMKSEIPITNKLHSSAGGGEKSKKWWELGLEKEEKGKVYGGILQGAAAGAGNYFAAKEAAEGQKDLERYRYRIDREKIEANKPGKSAPLKTAKITIRNRWEAWVN